MKKLLKLLCVILLVSCEKEPLTLPCENTYPTTQNPVPYVDDYFIDDCWLLVDGEMYLENLETDEIEMTNHFTISDSSSLRYDSSMYEFEDLVKNVTTWCFYLPDNIPGMGHFTLDGDTLQPYGLSVTHNNITITEPLVGSYLLLGGSGRPILYEILDFENKIIMIHVQESYENINGYNCRYYSKLKFKKN